MPCFGDLDIFGTSVSMVTTDRPRSRKSYGLFGLNAIGVDSCVRSTEVTGLLFGVTMDSLASKESLFGSTEDGISRSLTDALGVTWFNVRLVSFQPQGRIRQSPAGMFFRAYKARFLHADASKVKV